MCAQIVARYPPPGDISVVSQSGNLVSSFLNCAVETGVGISKAISCGNQAQTSLADFLEYFAADPETRVALAYLEGLLDGPRFIDVVRRLTATKPLVLIKAVWRPKANAPRPAIPDRWPPTIGFSTGSADNSACCARPRSKTPSNGRLRWPRNRYRAGVASSYSPRRGLGGAGRGRVCSGRARVDPATPLPKCST